ncbi:MAG: hypothetical protein IPP07_27815 [Holophagales bacterium]|nr:hypothetical protein [Holophagales bacterium]
MSGPVWKLLKMPGTCDSCGENATELLSVGTVVDYAFRPDYRFCRSCYDRYEGRHDELHPKAVREQQLPPLVSRPDSVEDVPE